MKWIISFLQISILVTALGALYSSLWVPFVNSWLIWGPHFIVVLVFICIQEQQSGFQITQRILSLLAIWAICSIWNWSSLFWLCFVSGVFFSELLLTNLMFRRVSCLLSILMFGALIFFVKLPQLLMPTLEASLYRNQAFTVIVALFLSAAITQLLSAHQDSSVEHDNRRDFLAIIFFGLLMTLFALLIAAIINVQATTYQEATWLVLLGGVGIVLTVTALWMPISNQSLGVAFARHLVSTGTPLDEWVSELAQIARTEGNQLSFMKKAMINFIKRTQASGVTWEIEGDHSGEEGETKGFKKTKFEYPPLTICLFFRRSPPKIIWLNYYIMVRIMSEFYLSKRREMRYSADRIQRSIHETGSRLTHDIKNILHTMKGICTLSKDLGKSDHQKLEVLNQQLPTLAKKLENTLAGLLQSKNTQINSEGKTSALVWWGDATEHHYSHKEIEFHLDPKILEADTLIPHLFDQALENFLHNAFQKAIEFNNEDTKIIVHLQKIKESIALSVTDNGDPVPEKLLPLLFKSIVSSSNGLGIGLYHLSIEAIERKYRTIS